MEALQPDVSPKVTRAALGILAALKRRGLTGASLSSEQLSQVSFNSTLAAHIWAQQSDVVHNMVLAVGHHSKVGAQSLDFRQGT